MQSYNVRITCPPSDRGFAAASNLTEVNDLKTVPYPADSQQVHLASAIGPAILAVCIGVFLVYGAGFAHPLTIHDFAHDTRHAIAFPCH